MSRKTEPARVAQVLLKKNRAWEALCPSFTVPPFWRITPNIRHYNSGLKGSARDGTQVLHIRPSFTFGSGGNTLTRAALSQIPLLCQDLPRRDSSILDLGCGSGILALACATLGYTNVTGMDISAPALFEAKANAKVMGPIGRRVKWTSSLDGLGAQDLIIANLYGHLFFEYLPVFKTLLAPGGRIYTCGFDRTQEQSLIPAYEAAGFLMRRIQPPDQGWPQMVWTKN